MVPVNKRVYRLHVPSKEVTPFWVVTTHSTLQMWHGGIHGTTGSITNARCSTKQSTYTKTICHSLRNGVAHRAVKQPSQPECTQTMKTELQRANGPGSQTQAHTRSPLLEHKITRHTLTWLSDYWLKRLWRMDCTITIECININASQNTASSHKKTLLWSTIARM